QEVHYIAGKGSILAKIRTAGTLDLEQRLDQINQIKNVSFTETTIVLKTDLESMSLPIKSQGQKKK
ncbi:MAG: Lrp/AsnC ligand binding domain-containing protein, partial [Candidatus Marinimicrobia bacterium]|nr:Lrp/AsnC ligand binding domain-containing protein [Candidatus Neomarinimicrobiota bacterium]